MDLQKDFFDDDDIKFLKPKWMLLKIYLDLNENPKEEDLIEKFGYKSKKHFFNDLRRTKMIKVPLHVLKYLKPKRYFLMKYLNLLDEKNETRPSHKALISMFNYKTRQHLTNDLLILKNKNAIQPTLEEILREE